MDLIDGFLEDADSSCCLFGWADQVARWRRVHSPLSVKMYAATTRGRHPDFDQAGDDRAAAAGIRSMAATPRNVGGFALGTAGQWRQRPAILVTGGAGYIGSHMVWELLDAGEEVVVLDRLSTGFDWAVAPEAKLYRGDVGDAELVSGILRDHAVDAIIHFAGSVVVPDSVVDPLGYYENNTGRTRTLLETAVRAGVPHFIFSSTAAVYGSVGMEPVREDARLAPESPYGRSKLMSEWMLADAAQPISSTTPRCAI